MNYDNRAPAGRSQQALTPRGGVQKMGGASGLAEVLAVILEKGIVIDAWVRLSIIGIEILTLEIRAVIASVDTYLRYAEARTLPARHASHGQGDAVERSATRGPPTLRGAVGRCASQFREAMT